MPDCVMVFHRNSDRDDEPSGSYVVAGLSTGANNWCSVGAYTRLARYSDWVTKTIEYLEGIPTIDRDFVPEETPRRGQGSPREDGTFAGQTTDGIGCILNYLDFSWSSVVTTEHLSIWSSKCECLTFLNKTKFDPRIRYSIFWRTLWHRLDRISTLMIFFIKASTFTFEQKKVFISCNGLRTTSTKWYWTQCTCHKNLFTSEFSKCYQNVILTMTMFVLNALSPWVHLNFA